MERLYGLIGRSLSHSFSKEYFEEKFRKEGIEDARYVLFPLDSIEEFSGLIEAHQELRGLNVTIPYKSAVIPYLSELDRVGREIGAVNAIKVDNALIGTNTDAAGFRRSLVPLLKPHQEKALILGTGGASRAVSFVLRELGIPYLFVSRDPKGQEVVGYDALDAFTIETHPLIINTTPLGMAPNEKERPPIPYEYITGSHLLYDLIYNPGITPFLEQGKAQGAMIKNGLEMLHLQAEAAWDFWNQ